MQLDFKQISYNTGLTGTVFPSSATNAEAQKVINYGPSFPYYNPNLAYRNNLVLGTCMPHSVTNTNSKRISFTSIVPNSKPVDNKINLENIISNKDKRTTVMIRHIPNKYTLSNLVDELNSAGFLGKYDYVNLPVDHEVRNII